MEFFQNFENEVRRIGTKLSAAIHENIDNGTDNPISITDEEARCLVEVIESYLADNNMQRILEKYGKD